jgi:hypothetical protein
MAAKPDLSRPERKRRCYCGSAILGNEVGGRATVNNQLKWTGADVATKDYDGRAPDQDVKETGILLGAAITNLPCGRRARTKEGARVTIWGRSKLLSCRGSCFSLPA